MTKSNSSILRLATYNVRVPCDKAPNNWEARQPKVINLLNKYNIHIAGLQEATKRQIDGILTDKSWDFVGKAREDGIESGEFSCIIFRKNRFQVLETDTFWLSETPKVPGSKSWNTACTRICTWAKFKDLETNAQFTHFNTHLDHVSKDAQVNGMKLIIDTMKAVTKDEPVILTGDFNVFPGNKVLEIAGQYLKAAEDITMTPKVGPDYTYNAFTYRETGVTPTHPGPIDYIYLRNNVKVKALYVYNDADEEKLYPSDHFPVVADLIL